MLIQMECKQCDFRPGEATVPDVAVRAALADYRQIGNRHAFTNSGHVIVTRIDGAAKRMTVFAMKNVPCDQCFENIPKADCDILDGLVICRRCSGYDPCECVHQRRRHHATGCSYCLECTGFQNAEAS